MTSTSIPRVDESTLPDGVSTTFDSWCGFGCVVRTVHGQEQPHVCVGEQLIAGLAPELPYATAKRIAAGVQPLLRELKSASWEDGICAGRAGVRIDGDDRPRGLKIADAYIEIHLGTPKKRRRLARTLRQQLRRLDRRQR